MKLIDDIRRQNLASLVREHGTLNALAERLGREASQVSQWLNGSVHSATGKRRGMRSESARFIESQCDKPTGWLDMEHSEPAMHSDGNVRPAIQQNGLRPYPVISGVTAGGWGDAIQPFEPGAEDRVEYTGYQPKGMAFWLEVEGDSMHSPTDPQSVTEGSLILVDTGIEAYPGCLVVAKLDVEEKATFKKLVSDAGQLYLKPLNPAYRMIPINGNCRIIGVVKESKRKH